MDFNALVEKISILRRHFRFYLSRSISYPLVEPDMLQLCFLFRCNLKCKMCSMQERYEKIKHAGLSYELPFDIIKKLIEQAANMKIRKVCLVGGEPFLREDLFDIINFIHRYDMETIVITNGTLLGNIEIINRVLDSKLRQLAISIDGACENTYRRIRGDGVLERIKNNIRLLNKIKKERESSLPKVHISCTIMDQNIEELVDIVCLARELGVGSISFQPVVRDNTDARVRDNSDLNWIPKPRYNVLDSSIDKLVKYKLSSRENNDLIINSATQLKLIKKYFRGILHNQKCYLGFSRIVISQDGKMYFCAKEPIGGKVSFGDIYKDKLRDLWYSKKAQLFRRSIKKCSSPCLLGCACRNEFDRIIGDFYYRYFYRSFGKLVGQFL